jgi:hypothetical protein
LVNEFSLRPLQFFFFSQVFHLVDEFCLDLQFLNLSLGLMSIYVQVTVHVDCLRNKEVNFDILFHLSAWSVLVLRSIVVFVIHRISHRHTEKLRPTLCILVAVYSFVFVFSFVCVCVYNCLEFVEARV